MPPGQNSRAQTSSLWPFYDSTEDSALDRQLPLVEQQASSQGFTHYRHPTEPTVHSTTTREKLNLITVPPDVAERFYVARGTDNRFNDLTANMPAQSVQRPFREASVAGANLIQNIGSRLNPALSPASSPAATERCMYPYDPVRMSAEEAETKFEPVSSDNEENALTDKIPSSRPGNIGIPTTPTSSPAITPSPAATPDSSTITGSPSASSATNFLSEQRQLLRKLVSICTTAARIYWIHTRPSPRVFLRYSLRPGRVTPYDRSLGSLRSSYRALSYRTLREIQSEDSRLTLRDLLSRICDQMWERAMLLDSRQEEGLVIQRMADLYSWAHCLGRANRKVEGERETLGEQDVITVFVAARDLTAWLLFEEGKREVQALWGRYGLGGGLESFEW
jgi:hypothetical protein